MQEFLERLLTDLQHTSLLEYIAVFTGIASVWFSRKENIWVYPIGLISTIIYVYISSKSHLIGEASVNIYYSILSIYGWILWSKNSKDHIHVEVSWATKKEWIFASFLFVISTIMVTVLYYYKPYIDNQLSFEVISLGLYHLDWAN